jgi:peptidoglycan hydrolase-like protein with peptidoglycan-binding domain
MHVRPSKSRSNRARRRFRVAESVVIFALGVMLSGGRAFPQEASKVQAYQEMLIWTGDYDGMIDGKLGAGTLQAIKNFQKRNLDNPSGDLSDQEATLLAQLGRSRKQAVGFAPYRDTEAGVTVGIPTKLLANPKKSKWGTNWPAVDDRINIDTLRITGMTLRELFDKLSGFRNRRVKYSVFRENWFVISGLDMDDAAVYVRAAADPAGNDVRGFSVRIGKKWREELGHIPVAMSSSFSTFSPLVADKEPPRLPQLLQTNLPPRREAAGPADVDECYHGLGTKCPAAFLDK